MDRDNQTGRFISGNKSAIGNKGNRSPKWGNKNARKHGLFETLTLFKVQEDGWLLIYQINAAFKVHPDAFYISDDGAYMIHTDVVQQLRNKGVVLPK